MRVDPCHPVDSWDRPFDLGPEDAFSKAFQNQVANEDFPEEEICYEPEMFLVVRGQACDDLGMCADGWRGRRQKILPQVFRSLCRHQNLYASGVSDLSSWGGRCQTDYPKPVFLVIEVLRGSVHELHRRSVHTLSKTWTKCSHSWVFSVHPTAAGDVCLSVFDCWGDDFHSFVEEGVAHCCDIFHRTDKSDWNENFEQVGPGNGHCIAGFVGKVLDIADLARHSVDYTAVEPHGRCTHFYVRHSDIVGSCWEGFFAAAAADVAFFEVGHCLAMLLDQLEDHIDPVVFVVEAAAIADDSPRAPC